MTNQDKPMSEALEAVRGMMEADRSDEFRETPQTCPTADSGDFDTTMDAPAANALADSAVLADALVRPPGRAEVLEEIIVEQITPIVQDWHDKHLPDIVARVVEREVRDLLGRRGS